VLSVVGRNRARCPRPHVKAVAARLPANPSGHVFRSTGQPPGPELVETLPPPLGVLQHLEHGHDRRGRIKDEPAQHDDLAYPVAEAAEPDGRPAAVRLSHQHHRADAGWIAPGILEALIPGRMQGHGGTAEVSRGAA
jgi:hypothetical protein